MAARTSTPKPGRRKGNRGRPPKRTPSPTPSVAALSIEESLKALAARAQQAEAAADEAGTAATALGVHYAAQRLVRWADAFAVDLSALATRDADGSRRLPPAVLLAYATQLARPGSISADWFLDTLGELRTALRSSNIAVAGFTDRAVPEVAEIIDALSTQLEDSDRRPAAPVLIDHLIEIDDTFKELDVDPVWVAALRAWQSVSWTFGGRAVETTTRLNWNDFTELDNQDRLRWPAGCKYQDADITLERTRSSDLPVAADVRRQLETLRSALRDAGHDPRPDDPIFPLIDPASGEVIIGPVDALLDDPSFRPDLSGLARRGRAERSVTQRYRKAWTRAAATTSLASNLGHRTLAPHGLRRALATILAALGKTDLTIRHEMRHGHLSTTLLYVDGRCLPVSDAYALLDDLDSGRPVTDPHGLLAGALALVAEAECEHHRDQPDMDGGPLPVLDWDGGCSVDGCWKRQRGDVWAVTVEGSWRVVCTGHLGRLNRGEPNWDRPLELCSASRPASPCNVGPLVKIRDGDTSMRVCNSCHSRYRRALARGDTSDWLDRRARHIGFGTKCEADCKRTHGPGSGFQRFTVDGRTWILCGAHAARARNGAPAGWTGPIGASATEEQTSGFG